MTAKQALLAHLSEHHAATRTVGMRPWGGRRTLAELQRAHGYAHHHYGGPLMGHRHAGPDDPPNLGPDARPAGWRTGLDVVLQGVRER